MPSECPHLKPLANDSLNKHQTNQTEMQQTNEKTARGQEMVESD